MTRLDVVRVKGGGLAILCQADRLDQLSTRFTVPLLPPHELPRLVPGLHPEFTVNGEKIVMATHLAGAIPARAIEETICSLQNEEHTVQRALDTLSGSY